MFHKFTSRKTTADERRQEALSAYLDGELSAVDQARLQRDLAQDAALRAELEALRRTVVLVKSAPVVPLPRSFTLDPAAYGRVAPRRLYLYPALRAATAVATLAFVFVLLGTFVLGGMGAGAPADTVAMEPLMEKSAEEVVVEVTLEAELAQEVAEADTSAAVTEEVAAKVVEEEVEAAPVEEEQITAEPEAARIAGEEPAAEGMLETPAQTPTPAGTAPLPTEELGDGVSAGSPAPPATETPMLPSGGGGDEPPCPGPAEVMPEPATEEPLLLQVTGEAATAEPLLYQVTEEAAVEESPVPASAPAGDRMVVGAGCVGGRVAGGDPVGAAVWVVRLDGETLPG